MRKAPHLQVTPLSSKTHFFPSFSLWGGELWEGKRHLAVLCGLTLALCSEITPSYAQGIIQVPGMEPETATCKASTLIQYYLSHVPKQVSFLLLRGASQWCLGSRLYLEILSPEYLDLRMWCCSGPKLLCILQATPRGHNGLMAASG